MLPLRRKVDVERDAWASHAMPDGRPMTRAGRGALAAWLGLVVALVLAAAGCASPVATPAPTTTVTVLGSWEGPEIDAFRHMVLPFEERTGYEVVVSTTRDLKGALERSIATGDPPDLAGLPGPGYMRELASQDHLVDLANVIDTGTYKRETAPGFVTLGTVDGRLVGVFIKGTVKGLFWYDPDVFRPGALPSWSELQLEATRAVPGVKPWCIGLASDAASGWPGTDWVEDFVLRQSGPEFYDDWVAGRVRWTSPEIRWAFQSFGTVIADSAVAGGVDGALRTHFSRAGDGLFTDPPTCLLAHQGTFMSTFLDETVATEGGSYDFVPFPDMDPEYGGALIGAGDLFALTRDTPGGRELMRYLISADAQRILVANGGALSGNLTVEEYPDDITRRQAELLADAEIFRFDASDSMPDEMNEAFWQAILDYTADPSRLDTILAQLDEVQAVAYADT
jgi:alpha-glucoside transport system substrate-binding protein